MEWSRFFHRAKWDDERAKELADYLAQEIDDNIARGMNRDDATRAAHVQLGNTTRIREEIYEMNTLRLLDALWRDLRYGMRLLIRNPTFAVVAVLTLALGTGANAAIFQLVNAVRFRTLPVERPEELASVGIDHHGKGRIGRSYTGRPIHTEVIWDALRAEQQAFSSIAAWGSGSWDLSSEGEPQRINGFYVSGRFFETLGVRPHVGRLLTESDDKKGCGTSGAVLSYGFWRSRYGGNPGVVGQPIVLERRPFEIVGVAPPHFFGVEVGRTFDIAVPICADVLFRPRFRGRQDVWWLDIMGRLKPDWTVARAQAHLEALSPALFKATAPPSYNAEAAANYLTNTFTVARAETGVSNLRTRYATPLWVLLGATGLVLLITCANLANLMLARATARDREIAVRLAIGASRGRIVRQLLSESLLIAGLGAMGGILLSRWLSQSLVSYLGTGGGTRAIDLTPDWRVFGFIMLVAVTACLVFGLSPALKATRTDPGKTMHAGGRSSTDTHEAMTLRRALVVVQVALSMVLVVGAVLFGRTLRNLTTTDLGFRTGGIVAATVDLQRANIDRDALPAVYQQIVERMRAVPGIEHASEVFLAPLSGATWDGKIVVGGAAQTDMVNFNQIGAEYFRTMDIPLLEGRTFDATDRPGTPLRAVVNEAFARRYFGGKSPVGQTFQQEAQPGAPQSPYHVIGLVKNTKYANLREPFAPIAYLSWTQEPQLPPFVHVVVRSDLPLASLRGPLTQAVLGAAPGTSVAYRVVTNYISESLVTERLMASLSGFFGVLAMLIASIGLYGVMSYMVTRRKVEIGIRMALGANPADVIRMVLKESGMLLIVGVVVGSSLAVAASQYAATLLFGLTPWDPASFAAAAVTLALVSLLAAWIPARRASRLAPTIALRE